jgi:hypothetical protein
MPVDPIQFGGIAVGSNPPFSSDEVIPPTPRDIVAEERFRRELPRIAREQITRRWLQNGGPASPVGLPLDPSFPVLKTANGHAVEFRGGRISFQDHDGQLVQSDLHHVVVTFEGFGLEVRQESGDELYGTVHSQIGSTGFRQDFVLPEVSLGPEDTNRVAQYGTILYEGPPIDLNVVLSLVEHDSGDRAKVRDEVRLRVGQLFKAAEDLAAGSPTGDPVQVAGMGLRSEALASSSLKDWLITAVADLINDLLGMGDDPYNMVGFTIAAAEMQTLPPLRQYRCWSDTRMVEFTHSRMTTCRDDAGDVGQITALFSVRAR